MYPGRTGPTGLRIDRGETKMRRIALAALTVALLAPAAASAQGAYRFELTPQVGYRWGGEISGDSTELFDADLKIDEGEAFGLTLDIPLSRNLQLELLASQQQTQFTFDEGLFGGTFDVADVDVNYYHVGLLFQGGSGEINPFFVASAGITRLDPDVPGADTEDRFSLSLGGGVKVFFNEHVGMRFEGRGFFTVIDDYDSGCYDHGCYDYYEDGETLAQGQASAGLIFAW
ncbi:MAG: porin family protein [Thermoanaerobaculia bacterium]|nr:MAG: porin family protein [Thermoanaerobaculia bacterium]